MTLRIPGRKMDVMRQKEDSGQKRLRQQSGQKCGGEKLVVGCLKFMNAKLKLSDITDWKVLPYSHHFTWLIVGHVEGWRQKLLNALLLILWYCCLMSHVKLSECWKCCNDDEHFKRSPLLCKVFLNNICQEHHVRTIRSHKPLFFMPSVPIMSNIKMDMCWAKCDK